MQIYNGSYYVYIHYFPNGKVYVGITCVSPKRRWRPDGSGYKHQSVMWSAIQKYGWGNIQHEIIASNLTQVEACNFEILLIRNLKSTDHRYGYNIDNGGQTTGTTRRKISSTLKETQRYKRNSNTKPVICIETGAVFSSITEAAKSVGLTRFSLKRPLIDLKYTAGGYHWKYVYVNELGA